MKHLVHPDHPFRIFLVSGFISVTAIVLVGIYLGWDKAFIALVLMLVEITFSFENAIINAKVLNSVSKFWQTMFVTVGIFIAVFGMRLVFPIAIVMVTSSLGAAQVIDLAINKPDDYAQALHDSHASIATFGGMFLLMLCLHFFFDKKRKICWIDIIEKPLQNMSQWWLYSVVSLAILVIITVMPGNPHPQEGFVAGLVGIATYLVIHGLAELFARKDKQGASHAVKTGMAGFMAFLYLEVLDASFSFDGVIGAFAVTKNVLLIAIGLGVGALWVRSLTIYMVRRHVLHAYRYLEHGAHYTIGVLAIVLLVGLFIDVPELIAGIAGIVIVGTAITSSIAATRKEAVRRG